MIQDEIIYMKNARRMDKCLVYVEDNVTNIPRRLQEEVDPNFFIMFNPKTQKFEIHRRGRNDYTLELNLPFEELDSRAIDYVLNSRDIKRAREEMEEHNAKLDESNRKRTEHIQSCKTRDLFDYCNHHSDKETLDENAYKTRFM